MLQREDLNNCDEPMEKSNHMAHVLRAAKPALYNSQERRQLIEEPLEAIRTRTRTLEIRPQAVTTFLEMIDGSPVDLGPLMDLGNQLWKIAPSKDAESAEKKDYELAFEEEQLLLLASHLLEDAFFRGDLLALKGTNSAIGLFIVNRIGKVVELMSPDVREHFVWTRERWDSLLANVRRFIEQQTSETVLTEKIAPLQAEQERLEAQIRAMETPAARELKYIEDRLVVVNEGIYSARAQEITSQYVSGIRQRAQNALLAFDQHFPKGFADYHAAKGLLKDAYNGLRQNHIIDELVRYKWCVGRVARVMAEYKYDAPRTGESEQQIENKGRAAAQKDAGILKAAAAATNNPALRDALEELSKEPTGEIAELIALRRERKLLIPRRAALSRQLEESPDVDPEIRGQLDKVNRDLAVLLKTRANRSACLKAFDSSAQIFLREREARDATDRTPHGVRELYFLKSYIVAAYMRDRSGFVPEFLPPSQSEKIEEFWFTMERTDGIAKAHFNASNMAVAKWIVEYQLSQSRVREPSAPFVLRSKRADAERNRARFRKERITDARDVYGEYLDLHDRQTAFRAILWACDELEYFSDGLSSEDLESIESERLAAEARWENAARDSELLKTENALAFSDLDLEPYATYSEVAARIAEVFPDLERSDLDTFDFQMRLPMMSTRHRANFFEALPDLEARWSENPSIVRSFFQAQSRGMSLYACVGQLEDLLGVAQRTGAGKQYIGELTDEVAFMRRLLRAEGERIDAYAAENPTLFPAGAFSAEGRVYDLFFAELRRSQDLANR